MLREATLEMCDDARFFTNTFRDYDGKDELLSSERKLSEQLVDNVKKFLTDKLVEIVDVIERRKISLDDASVYTGLTGLAMLFWKVSLSEHTQHEAKKRYTEMCVELLSTARSKMRMKRVTFLCGESGVLAMSAVVVREGSARYIQEVKEMYSQLNDDRLPDEVLYGRSGYLFSLLFIEKHCQPDPEIDDLITNVAQMIIAQGKKNCEQSELRLPLYYAWHGKEYIGAAHGYIGILYMLLQAKNFVPGSMTKSDDKIVTKCLHGLLDQRYPSGNIRSSAGSDMDKLVHWCHGAPGAVHLYALAYKIYGDRKYLEAARLFADVIWRRGLLRKGYGVCHGVAGNAYGLLCMYQLTKEKAYLSKVMKFTEWCVDYGQHGCRVADRPHSLYEGLSGTLYFVNDMLSPDAAAFPAFQLINYQ